MAKSATVVQEPSQNINVANQVVVPLIHVETVLNKVIPDLEKVLHSIQGWDNEDETKRCITKEDIEMALSTMRKRMVSEIRYL